MVFNGAPFTELPRNDLLDSYESRLLLMNPTAHTNDAFSKTTSESGINCLSQAIKQPTCN